MAGTLDDEVADLRRANAELRKRLDEALDQQTATADVLQVINSSPGDLAPVFDAMLEKAMRLCETSYGNFVRYDGHLFRMVATRNMPQSLVARGDGLPVLPGGSYIRLVEGEPIVHVTDLAHTDAYRSGNPGYRALVDEGSAHTAIWVALRQNDTLLGAFVLYRQEVRPFTGKQIALLQNFAVQAVIAMENARLITETREALEQQTATAEVLQVINSSPGDLAPVFDAVLEKAMRQCDADFGTFWILADGRIQTIAQRGTPEPLTEFLREPMVFRPGGSFARLIEGEPLLHMADMTVDDEYSARSMRRALVELGNARTSVWVPLRKEGTLIGGFTIYRQEVRPFTEKQIALLQTFAAQAVIAMENARLITETREALDQQTATAEVLQVINSSPGDLAPVFNAILEKAHLLCGAAKGALCIYEGDHFRAVATRGLSGEYADLLRAPQDNPAGSPPQRLLAGESIVHVTDFGAIDLPIPRAAAALEGARTVLFVPLQRDSALLGYISIYRQEVRPFSDKQIALLQNFAAQAVIAMENARLITETREALDQQTATAEVLQVINASPGDLAPVFEAMLEKARHLCDAAFGSLLTYDGERFHAAALHRVPPGYAQFLQGSQEPGAGTALARVVNEHTVQVADAATSDNYRKRSPLAVAGVELGGVRTLIVVPLLKDDVLLGVFHLYRQEVRPFTDKQIALLQNFAAQAVIAMENARLITETREALDQQTATAEVLQVINSSPGDLAPVFEAMLEKAMRLCEAAFGVLQTYDGHAWRTDAARGVPPAYAEFRRNNPPAYSHPGTGPARLLAGERVVHIVDLKAEDAYRSGDPNRLALVDFGGARTSLHVALVKDEKVRGCIQLYSNEVRPFSDKQIALLENFAAQAMIAMENARLITETREALDQQTATAEVLGVINSSPGDLTPVFEAILEKAHGLCGAAQGALMTYDGDKFRAVATRGVPEPFAAVIRGAFHPHPDNPISALVRGESLLHVLDVAEVAARTSDDNAMPRIAAHLGGVRTLLMVPLRKDDALLGLIAAYRTEVRAFTDKEIVLLQNFAAQAVIAMENARLLDEIRQRQAELRVTFDNMADGVVMFDEDLRLAAWNRNFQELLDLPDAALAQRPSYADYLRMLAERGEFGTDDIEAELSRRLEETDQELRLERTRPDGRVIEVRRSAVPDGGFVLIYSDITERKRSEAEIRAARDTAEATLRDLRAAQANLIQAEKMASLGQLTAGIAHEIKNPLNFVNNFAGLSVELLDELREATAPAVATLGEDKRAEIDETMVMLTGNLEKIAEHGKRADNIVKSMLEHSRGVTGERREVDLNNLIDEALNLAYHGARAQDQTFNITLEREYGAALTPIEVAPQEITRVFLNLFGNGFYAANKRVRENDDGSFRPSLAVATRDFGDAIEVRIRDNGDGIPAEIRDKLFQPFFTTKPTGEGTGLGLSISYDIITQQHGGTITVDSRIGEFTEFTILLPRNSQATSTGAAA